LTIAALSIFYAYAPSIAILLSLVPIHGVFWSGLMTASAAHLVDLVPGERRAEGIAYWGLASVAAIAVAPSVGFWLYDRGEWIWLCGASAGLNVVMALIAVKLVKSKKVPDASASEKSFIEWRVLVVSLTLFLFSFGYGGVTSFVALYATASGTAAKGAYFTVLAGTILFSRPVFGKLADRVGYKRVFVPCLAVTSVGLALLIPGGTLAWLVASALVFGLGFGSAFPVYTAHVMQYVSPARRGAAFGSMLAAFDTGIGTGSLVLGYVIERSDYRTAFAIAAAIAAIALPYFLFIEPRVLVPRES